MNAETNPAAPDPTPAFRSDCELLNATWSLDSGRCVEFRIAGQAFDRLHPFKRFTQKRNGRVGTRFTAAIAHRRSDGTGVLVYHGDAMLKAWGDSSSVGQSFNLWLDDEADRHPFAGFDRRKSSTPGEIFYVVLIELQDDETPVDQDKRARAEGHDRPLPRRTGRKPSQAAHLIVTSAMFVRWLSETKPNVVKQWTPELARKYVKQYLKIESLSQLDQDPALAARFDEKIRKAFNRWNEQAP